MVVSLGKQGGKTMNSSQLGLYETVSNKEEEGKKTHISLKRDENSSFPGVEDQPGR